MKILNAGPGFTQPMTEDEAMKFLSSGKRNIYLGTIDKRNEPNIHPTWFHFDPDKMKIYVETSKFSKKRENLNNSNIVYFCVDDSTLPYKGVRGKGKINVTEDIDFIISISEKNMMKYLGSLDHPMAKVLLESAKNGNSVLIEISPLYLSTWDDGKIT
ncbi:MAG: pyridoxamine 5'-phosphate oxidase family protein [Nitrososphaeraceae archaeon]